MPRADLVLHNAQVVTPLGIVHGGVAIRDEAFVAIAADADLPGAEERIDCEGRVMLPGIVDPHVHLGGSTPYDEICRTESLSAAAGGVTTLLQYRRSFTTLLDTFPDDRAASDAYLIPDTGFHFILNNMDQVKEIPDYAHEFGVTSFKFYMGGYPPGNPIGLVTVTDAILYEAMQRIRDLPLGYCMVHCEDDSLVEHLTDVVKSTGREDLPAYTESRPGFTEEQDILRAIWLAELTSCPLYIPHTTIGSGIEAAAEARRRGAKVIVETCPHYLALTADDERLASQGAGVGKVAPALRDEENREMLWQGLRDGSVHTIGSDHVPIRKTGAALWEEKPGFAGLATMLPVVLTEGVLKGRLSMERVAQVMSLNPARVFGYAPRKGSISVGSDGDVVVVDLEREATVGPETTFSTYTSAFEGMTLKGWPTLTVRRGEVIFRDGEVIAEQGSGRILERAASEDSGMEESWT